MYKNGIKEKSLKEQKVLDVPWVCCKIDLFSNRLINSHTIYIWNAQ